MQNWKEIEGELQTLLNEFKGSVTYYPKFKLLGRGIPAHFAVEVPYDPLWKQVMNRLNIAIHKWQLYVEEPMKIDTRDPHCGWIRGPFKFSLIALWDCDERHALHTTYNDDEFFRIRYTR